MFRKDRVPRPFLDTFLRIHLASYTQLTMAGDHATLPLLSTEILVQIFTYLDPVHSTCLALACRRLYHIHFSKYENQRIALESFTYDCPIPGSNHFTLCYLFSHLKDWKPKDLVHCWGCHKFCKSNSANKTQTSPLIGKCESCTRHELELHKSSRWRLSTQSLELSHSSYERHRSANQI